MNNHVEVIESIWAQADETATEPTFAQAVAAENASQSSRSDGDVEEEQPEAGSFAEEVKVHNSRSKSKRSDADAPPPAKGSFGATVAQYNSDPSQLLDAPQSGPDDAPEKNARQLFLEAIRSQSSDHGRSNEESFQKAEASAATEGVLANVSDADKKAFMEAYGFSEEDLQLPQIRRILERDLGVNKEQSEDGGTGEKESEEKDDAKEQEPATPAEPVKPVELPATVQELYEDPEKLAFVSEHLNAVESRAKELTNPLFADIFNAASAEAFGVPAEARPEFAAGMELLRTGAQSLVETYDEQRIQPAIQQAVSQGVGEIVQHFGELLEQFAPGLGASFREAQTANIWSDVIEGDEFKGLGLPKFGTEDFQAAAIKVHQDNPWLETWDNPNLPPLEALKQKAEITARLLAGERVSPQAILRQVGEAVSRGRAEATRSQRRVTASRSMGAGTTKGQLQPKGDTSFADAIRDYNQAQKSGERSH